MSVQWWMDEVDGVYIQVEYYWGALRIQRISRAVKLDQEVLA